MKRTIKQEIEWCEKNRNMGKGKDYEDGFIAGLKQATMLLPQDALDGQATMEEAYDRIKKLEAALQDMIDLSTATMDEKCTLNEMHCTCVPFLKMEIARLNALLEEAARCYEKLLPDANENGIYASWGNCRDMWQVIRKIGESK